MAKKKVTKTASKKKAEKNKSTTGVAAVKNQKEKVEEVKAVEELKAVEEVKAVQETDAEEQKEEKDEK